MAVDLHTHAIELEQSRVKRTIDYLKLTTVVTSALGH